MIYAQRPWLALLTFEAASFALLSAPASVCADTSLKKMPPFETLVQIAPVVVIARMEKVTGTSVARFTQSVKAPFSDVSTHYSFSVEKLIKGPLRGQTFELRVLGGEAQGVRTRPLVTFEPQQRVLLLLTPDVGKDLAGKPRTGYVVLHGASFALVGDNVQVRTSRGLETWSVNRVEQTNARHQQTLAEKLAADPERGSARPVGVFSGEDGSALKESAPPDAKDESTANRSGAPTVSDSRPADVGSPDHGEREPKPGMWDGVMLAAGIILVVAVILVLFWRMRRGQIKGGTTH